jgi:hypothetical protein
VPATFLKKGRGAESTIYYFYTCRIYFFGQFQSIRIGQINVGRGNSQDEATRFCDIGEDHATYLHLNVDRLVTDGNFRQARQINQGQIKNYNTKTKSGKKTK